MEAHIHLPKKKYIYIHIERICTKICTTENRSHQQGMVMIKIGTTYNHYRNTGLTYFREYTHKIYMAQCHTGTKRLHNSTRRKGKEPI